MLPDLKITDYQVDEIWNMLKPSKNYWLNAKGFPDDDGLTYDGILAIPVRCFFSNKLLGFSFREFINGKWEEYLYPKDGTVMGYTSCITMGNKASPLWYLCDSYENMLSAKKFFNFARIRYFMILSPIGDISNLLKLASRTKRDIVIKYIPKQANEIYLTDGLAALGDKIITL